MLLNLSLCQAKFSSHEYSVQNCTRALKLLNDDIQTSLSTNCFETVVNCLEENEKEFLIPIADVIKVYYRRAQSLKAIGFLEESRSDFELCIQLQEYQLKLADPLTRKNIEKSLNSSKLLLNQVLNTLEQDEVKLINRLKKRAQNY